MADTDRAEHVEKAEASGREHLLGVVTTAPAILFEESRQSIGVGSNYTVDPHQPGVALVGRVPVKVNLENGPIQTGDPITVSGEEGVGMKATTSGTVVGTALEPYNESSEDSKIFVFVNPRMYVPEETVDISSSGTVTVNDTLSLEKSSLGTCGSSEAGQIKFNGTAHYACDGDGWEEMY